MIAYVVAFAMGFGAAWQVQAWKHDAAELAAREHVRIAERAATLARAEQSNKDSKNAKTVADLERKLRDAGRLRDPYAQPVNCGTTNTGNSGTDTTQAGGVLSAQFAGMLRDWAAEADAINIAYAASIADAAALRGLLASCGPAQ